MFVLLSKKVSTGAVDLSHYLFLTKKQANNQCKAFNSIKETSGYEYAVYELKAVD